MESPSTIFQVLSCGGRQSDKGLTHTLASLSCAACLVTSSHPGERQPTGRTHLDLDGEGVDEVLWDAVGVSCSVDAHGDELTL